MQSSAPLPVPLVLRDNKGIVVVIEDNGMKGTFKPAILYSSVEDSWRQGTGAQVG